MEQSEEPGPEPSPTEAFLSQPAYHADEDDEPVVAAPAPAAAGHATRRRLGKRLTDYLFDKRSSRYSSISPRRGDGTRTRIFPFNGNGRGR
jgi:hypothetical protein